MARIPFLVPSGPDGSGELYSRHPWERATLGGEQLPGIVTVIGLVEEYADDTKKPAGASGARTTLHGAKVNEFQIHLLLWRREQWERFEEIKASLFPPGKKPPRAFDFYHPAAADLGITAVVYKGRTSLVPDGTVYGKGTVTIKVRPFAPPARSGVGAAATTTPSYAVFRTFAAAPTPPVARTAPPRPVGTPVAPSLYEDNEP